MVDTILIKGGSGTTPTLQDRELAYNKEEKALYIGTKDGNVCLFRADDSLSAQIEDIITRLDALENPSE